MPDLTTFLETRAAAIDVATPDVRVVVAGARSRRRGAALVFVVALVLIALTPAVFRSSVRADLPASAPPSADAGPSAAPAQLDYVMGATSILVHPIYAVRTDADGGGLVANYVGGNCDAGIVLDVAETADTIVISVGGTQISECYSDDVGLYRSVSARVNAPVGNRTITSAGREFIPYDGADLLQPADLPAGFVQHSETGVVVPAPFYERYQEKVVDTSWSRTYVDASLVPASQRCPAGRGALTITQGRDYDPAPFSGTGSASTIDIGLLSAELVESSDATGTLTGRSLTWTVDFQTFVIAAGTDCPGDTVLDAEELARVAQSLGH